MPNKGTQLVHQTQDFGWNAVCYLSLLRLGFRPSIRVDIGKAPVTNNTFH